MDKNLTRPPASDPWLAPFNWVAAHGIILVPAIGGAVLISRTFPDSARWQLFAVIFLGLSLVAAGTAAGMVYVHLFRALLRGVRTTRTHTRADLRP